MKKIRIEICGGIASGKTTLTKLLENSNLGKGVFEDFKANQFWKAFYQEPGKFIFETEVTFTLQHYHQIKKELSDLIICDYSLLLDHAYADIGLTDTKYKIYESLLFELYSDIDFPTLIIFLECSSNEELKRIQHRNRDVESDISIDFLDSLNSAVSERLTKEKIKILKIDSEKYNFATNKKDQEYVVSLIKDKLKSI